MYREIICRSEVIGNLLKNLMRHMAKRTATTETDLRNNKNEEVIVAGLAQQKASQLS
jgi:hypothetical protein